MVKVKEFTKKHLEALHQNAKTDTFWEDGTAAGRSGLKG